MKSGAWGLFWFVMFMQAMCEPPRDPVCESLWKIFQETESDHIRFDAIMRYEDLHCDDLPNPPSRDNL